MRLQLSLLVAALLVSSVALADNEIDIGVYYFLEPAPSQRLHVVHPQFDLKVEPHRTFGIRLGYDADIVTGATPRTYGSGSAVDAISSATKFSDVRHVARAGIDLKIGPTTVDATYAFGTENDYRSHSLAVGAKVDLWGKNTTFRLGYSRAWDTTCDIDNRGAVPLERRALGSSDGCFEHKATGLRLEPLAINGYSVGWTQVISPIVLSDLAATFQVSDGFQSNPYRRVRLFFGTVEAQESHPLLRQRVAISGRMLFAIKRIRGALGAMARFYWDTWGIKSGTGEITYDQWLGSSLLLKLRARFYQQSRAVFYRDAGEDLSYEAVGPAGQYFSGDREMSPFRNWLFGLKLTYTKSAGEKGRIIKLFEAVDLHVRLDLMSYQALTPLPPNAQRSEGAIDAVVIQLGAILKF